MLSINQLSFGYGKRKRLFENLNLNLTEGNVYGLLGPNGAGKSSLLRLMAGLLQPTAGGCNADERPTFERVPSFLQDMFFLPEEFVTPSFKISELVSSVAPFYPKFSENQFLNYLSEFQIGYQERLKDLSYGQKKKVLIGFGLATNTRLLLMDEPTNGLDIPSKSQFRKIIASVASSDRIIVISTHQVRDLDSLIDPIIILHQNKVALNASTEEIAEKLAFKTVQTVENHEAVLYSEHSLRGFATVAENTKNEATKPDLELLFNAVMAHPDRIKNIFG
jgi:ABC-2 type transport system ATP-binding protein